MAFKSHYLKAISSLGEGSQWSYRTEDSFDTVLTPGYFNAGADNLSIGDVIFVTFVTDLGKSSEAYVSASIFSIEVVTGDVTLVEVSRAPDVEAVLVDNHVALMGDSFHANAHALTAFVSYVVTGSLAGDVLSLSTSSGSFPTMLVGQDIFVLSVSPGGATGTYTVLTVPSATSFTARSTRKLRDSYIGAATPAPEWPFGGSVYIGLANQLNSSFSWVPHWLATHGELFDIVEAPATSGTPLQNWYRYQLPQVRASTAKLVVLNTWFNSAFSSWGTVSEDIAFLAEKIVDPLLAEGRVVVAQTSWAPNVGEPYATRIAAWNPALQALAASRPNFRVIDASTVLTNDAVDLLADVLHLSALGAYKLGGAAATALSDLLSGTDALPSLGTMGNFLNATPLLDTTGGSFSSATNASGTVRGNLTAYRSSTAMTVVGSNEAHPTEGTRQIFTMSPTADGQTLVVKTEDVVPNLGVGEVYRGFAEVTITGMTQLKELWCGLDQSTGIGDQKLAITGLDAQSVGDVARFPQTARTVKLITPPVRLTTTPTVLRLGVGCKFGGSGSGQVMKVARMGILQSYAV